MKYEKVILHIENLIKESVLTSGSRLPSIRLLAKELDCSNSTVQKAYNKLVEDKFAYSIKKMGYFLMSHPENILPSENIDFSSEVFDNTILTEKDFKININYILSDTENISEDVLKQALKKFFINKKVFTNVHDIEITNSPKQAVNIIANTVLNKNQTLLVEDPTHQEFVEVMNNRTLTSKVSTYLRKGSSIDFSLLEFHFITGKIKLILITSDIYMISGYSMSLSDKTKLLELCYKYDVLIVEYDYLSDLYDFDEVQSIYSLDKHDIVFYVKSFSGIFSKHINITSIVSPRKYSSEIAKYKSTVDYSPSLYNQATLARFILSHYYEDNKLAVHNLYEGRLNLLRNIIEKSNFDSRFKVSIPIIGTFIFVEVPYEFNLQTMINELHDKNVKIKGISNNFYKEHHYKGFIISVTSVSKEDILKGVSIIVNYLEREA